MARQFGPSLWRYVWIAIDERAFGFLQGGRAFVRMLHSEDDRVLLRTSKLFGGFDIPA